MTPNEEIAIIGMAGRFPGAETVDELWQNIIIAKKNATTEFRAEDLIASGISPQLVHNSKYVRVKGYLENADLFDAGFFRVSQHEAEMMDPQYRILLEVVWEALENAGCVPNRFAGKIGIFAGASSIDSYTNQYPPESGSGLLSDPFMRSLLNTKDFLASLIAYKLNLTGPAVTLQTACSTSLVAVCMACQSLLSFESDVALAGGVCITMPLKAGYLFQPGMMLSEQGQCRAFDKNADGTVLGNGAGTVTLKRLADAVRDGDCIRAVIKGFAINNDGSNRIGFTAPSVKGQKEVIAAALSKARLTAREVAYIETHGTGTILGDMIEIEALSQVFQNVSLPVRLGTLKPNLGHLDVASGIAGLIKATQVIQAGLLPPVIHFSEPSPQLHIEKTPFVTEKELTKWDGSRPLYVGVSSFGMGGTNAHIILGEPPVLERSQRRGEGRKQLFPLSAKSQSALKISARNLAGFLVENPQINWADVAYTLQEGREAFKCRAICVSSNREELLTQLLQLEAGCCVGDSAEFSSMIEPWLSGGTCDWSMMPDQSRGKKVPLPTYPFERKRYWLTAMPRSKFKAIHHELIVQQEASEFLKEKLVAIFSRFLLQSHLDLAASFQELGGDSVVALLITHEINSALGLKIPFSLFDVRLPLGALCEYILNHRENV